MKIRVLKKCIIDRVFRQPGEVHHVDGVTAYRLISGGWAEEVKSVRKGKGAKAKG